MFSFHFRGMGVVLKGVKTSTEFRSYRTFSLTWPAAMQIYWNKRKFYIRKRLVQLPTGLVWDTNVAAVSLFCDTNIADLTQCENGLVVTAILVFARLRLY